MNDLSNASLERCIVLEAKGISKAFYHPTKVNLFNNLHLIARKGDSIAITGRSGEGKSTLLQILGTLDSPCSGSMEIEGEKVSFFNKSRLRNQKLGFIFQSFHLLEDYTTLENVLIPAKIARKDTSLKKEAYQRAVELLDHVGLKNRAHFSAKLLSGGEKQRVAIARALCNDPDILFADEPSGNLDKETAHHIHDILLSLPLKQKKTLIIVTHDTELASKCSKHYHLSNGQMTLVNF